jgi:hypothetical protein
MSTSDGEGQVRPFAAVLQEIGGGKFAARLAAQVAELSGAVKTTGKKGSITITIELAHVKKAAQNVVTVAGKSVAKIPEPEDASPSTVFFVDDDGVLSRDDPHQMQLQLRDVSRKDTA